MFEGYEEIQLPEIDEETTTEAPETVIETVPAEVVRDTSKPETTPVQAVQTPETALQQQQLQPVYSGHIVSMAQCYQEGRIYANSNLVPSTYRGKPEDCAIAIDMAYRNNLHPLMVMQNLYVVQGMPSWSGKACIAIIKNYFKSSAEEVSPVYVGDRNNDSWGCYFRVLKKNGTEIRGTTVTIQMAKQEGWYGKKGSKWQTMPELMLSYRAAAFFARVYCPEPLMGCCVEGEPEGIQASRQQPPMQTYQQPQRQAQQQPNPACADCGKPFKDGQMKRKDGTMMSFTAMQLYDLSRNKFNPDGIARCSDCMRKRQNH